VPAMTLAKSSKIAVSPPTYTRSVVPCSAAGRMSWRRRVISSEVAAAWGTWSGLPG
jgi:hypothetical protein